MERRILLPDGMSFDDAILAIEREKREANAVVSVYHEIKAYPLDGAVAFNKAAVEMFGFISTNGGTQVSVEIEEGKFITAPWGSFQLPGVDGELECGVAKKNNFPIFIIKGSIKKRFAKVVEELAQLTRVKVLTQSIYRGKALSLEIKDGQFGDEVAEPQFFALNGLGKKDLILPEATSRAVNAGLFTIIEKNEEVRRRGIPRKRCMVLAGPPGTGKTLAMAISAHLCTQHGRTFIYMKDVNKLSKCIEFVSFYGYGPALIAAEDIDRMMSERDKDANEILNAIDGVDTKNLDVLFVLTTNFRENLLDVFERAGRSDWILDLPFPDEDAALRLIEKYLGVCHSMTKCEMTAAAKLLAEAKMIPANIRECCDRSKLFAIADDNDWVTAGDLRFSALSVIEEKKGGKKVQPVQMGLVEKIAQKVGVEVENG